MPKAVKKGDYCLAVPNSQPSFGAPVRGIAVDAMPDVLVGIGLIEDAAVVTATMGFLAMEITTFRMWE